MTEYLNSSSLELQGDEKKKKALWDWRIRLTTVTLPSHNLKISPRQLTCSLQLFTINTTGLPAESEQFTTSCVIVAASHFAAVEAGRILSAHFNKINQLILTIEGKEQGQVDDCMF